MPADIQKNLTDKNVALMSAKLYEKSEILPPVVFNRLNIKKVCKRIGEICFHLQLENQALQMHGFWQNHKSNYVALFTLLPTPSWKNTLMDQFFFQNPHCWFTLEYFRSTFTNPANLSRDIGNLFQSTMGMPGMLDHTNKNYMIKL